MIVIYQNIFSVIFKQILGLRSQCRFSLSCSEYTKVAIDKKGLKKGLLMGLYRLSSCHPFGHNYE